MALTAQHGWRQSEREAYTPKHDAVFRRGCAAHSCGVHRRSSRFQEIELVGISMAAMYKSHERERISVAVCFMPNFTQKSSRSHRSDAGVRSPVCMCVCVYVFGRVPPRSPVELHFVASSILSLLRFAYTARSTRHDTGDDDFFVCWLSLLPLQRRQLNPRIVSGNIEVCASLCVPERQKAILSPAVPFPSGISRTTKKKQKAKQCVRVCRN